MKFASAQPVQDYLVDQRLFFDFISKTKINTKNCDPYAFKDLTASKDYRILGVENRDNDVLNCANHAPSYKMRYKSADSEALIEMTELKCKRDAERKPLYYEIIKEKDDSGNAVTDGNGNIVPVIVKVSDPSLYTFFCAAKIDETCENPNSNCDPLTNPECPIYTEGSPEKAASLKCPENKWLIDKKYYVLTHDPVCQRDFLYDAQGAVFYTKLPSGAPKRTEDISKHKCFTEYDCAKKAKLNIASCSKENKECVATEISNGNLKCADDRKLQIYSYKTNKTKFVTSYKCDTSSGNWRTAAGDVLELDSQISCPGNGTTINSLVVAEANLSDTAVYAIIGAIIVVVAIAVSVGAIFGRRAWTRRKFSLVKENKHWRKMKTPTRIKNCKNLFSDVLQATPSSALGITNGFNQIQLLLDEQIQEGECWEEAYPFIMRFQGAIKKRDLRIWHMFSRYMYLEAKKILDTHGWLTDKPIRMKKQHGLLRVAAIQMLSFALYDSTNEDAERLIISGYRKLGFKAVEQYPHCGVLWSVLMNAHATRKFSKKANYRVNTYLKHDEFVKTLRTIAFEGKMAIPAKDVIPVFGSVAEQAALALGNTPKMSFHMEHARAIMTTSPLQGDAGGGTVPLSYFKGMCMAPTRNPVPLILMALRMWPEHQPTLLEKFHKAAPATSWNELIESTSRMLIYYGRPLDAKRLLDRFMPTRNLDSFLGPLNLEQHLFEDALDKHLEVVRGWFETRTDIEILKGKPVYTIDGNTLLDARIDADAAKAEAPAAEIDAVAPAPESAAPAPTATAPNAAAPIPNAIAPSPNPAARTPNIAAPTPNAAAPAP